MDLSMPAGTPATPPRQIIATDLGVTPEVLRLRMALRAIHYNPDDQAARQAVAIRAILCPETLADILTGRAPLDRISGIRLHQVLAGAR